MPRRRNLRVRNRTPVPFAFTADGTVLMNAALAGHSADIRRAHAAASAHAPRVFVGVPLRAREARVMIKRVIEGGHEGVALICGARRSRSSAGAR
jgi:hypothetical protein